MSFARGGRSEDFHVKPGLPDNGKDPLRIQNVSGVGDTGGAGRVIGNLPENSGDRFASGFDEVKKTDHRI